MQDSIKTSLLKLNASYLNRAVKMFEYILAYMHETDGSIEQSQQIELAINIVQSGNRKPELRDELYMQILKQSRGNLSSQCKLKIWELALIVSATLPPSKVTLIKILH